MSTEKQRFMFIISRSTRAALRRVMKARELPSLAQAAIAAIESEDGRTTRRVKKAKAARAEVVK